VRCDAGRNVVVTLAGAGLVVVVGAAALVAYAYVGYPLALIVLAQFRRAAAPPGELSEWPSVSLTIPVYNEAANMTALLARLVELDYPADRCQILVVSDASTDGTDDIVLGFRDRGVELVRLPERRGKTAAENAARSLLRGEIIVNADASVRIDPAGLKALIAALADPAVGVASGRDVSVAATEIGGGAANVGESRYVGYEMWIRELETTVDGVVGVSGCFYAVRKPLHMELLPDALSRDFAAALVARERGYRAISVANAICFVPRTASLRGEYHRKVRTMTRGLETLWYKRGLLNPLRYGVFAWLLFSHKLCRWLVPWAFVALAGGLGLLAPTAQWARWALALQGSVLVIGAAGWLWPGRRTPPQLVSIASYLVAGTVAGLLAWLKALRGELTPVWEPTRRDVARAR
jgi:cellulose synthase/poly-beta-1,6-N-acetylglucosamine synthase-like glycosyltransferase